MKFQTLGESTDDFQRVIKKLVTFRFIHFIYEHLKPFKNCAIHVVFVWIQTYAVKSSMVNEKKNFFPLQKPLTCINHESSA